MKKALFFLAVLCVAGIFSAKAQSPSDSAFVRDLSFIFIQTNTLPYSTTGDIDIASGGKILKDLNPDCRATGYTINLTSSKRLDIKLSTGTWDSYLYVLDANYDTIIYNDDWKEGAYTFGSRIIHNFPAGQYFIIVSEYSSGSSSHPYTLSVDETSTSLTAFNALTYTPLTIGTSVTDTLRTSDGPIGDYYFGHYYRASYARAYTMQINNACVFDVTCNRSNRHFKLLDNNYNELYTNAINTPGTYRLVTYSSLYFDEDTSIATPFTITTSTSPLVNFNTLTYTPLGTFTDTTVNDTFSFTYPTIDYEDYLFKAKGYSFQGTQGKVVTIEDDYVNALYVLMDNNHNILRTSWYTVIAQLPQTGTYYLAILNYSGNECPTNILINNFQTYYVDGINGNDSRNGLTPGTAFATLDTALVRSGGIGKYYLTEDYTFSNNEVYLYFAQIYPYQKDIRLHMPTSGYNDVIVVWPAGQLVFGEEGSSYYFIIDSNRSHNFDNFVNANTFGSNLEVNNLKITNSYFPSYVFGGDEIIMRNCEFANDTFNGVFIGINLDAYNSLKLINCNISQNIFDYYFIYFNYFNAKFDLENSNIVGNTFNKEYPMNFHGFATANLTSGNWRNNRLSGNYPSSSNANITAQNAAGIWSEYSTINIGAGFTMDANNYLCIDTATTLNITENLSGNNVAQIYPYYYDGNDDLYKADYYEGRRVLWGSSSLLANNYQKFSVAQADNSALWYLHPDGTIHSYPESIDQAEEGTIRLYPNPANDVLNIALQGSEVNEAVVIDIYGKTVARTAVSEGNNTLNISALPAGMYFVQLRADNSVKSTQKIIKR
jgi:hypothetical protein